MSKPTQTHYKIPKSTISAPTVQQFSNNYPKPKEIHYMKSMKNKQRREFPHTRLSWRITAPTTVLSACCSVRIMEAVASCAIPVKIIDMIRMPAKTDTTKKGKLSPPPQLRKTKTSRNPPRKTTPKLENPKKRVTHLTVFSFESSRASFSETKFLMTALLLLRFEGVFLRRRNRARLIGNRREGEGKWSFKCMFFRHFDEIWP